MKYLIIKDKKRRNLFKKYEIKRKYLKYIINNKNIIKYIRINAMLKINKLPKDSSKIRIKNRCIITGRPKSIYRKFKMSRISLRNFAHNGLLTGILKSSW
jgi:small subunit ribosomal protein S14